MPLLSTEVHSSYILLYPKNSGYDTVNPSKIFLFAHAFMFFCCCFFFFYCKMSIFTSVFKEFLFAFTIPFTFLEFMNTLSLVKHLLTAGF